MENNNNVIAKKSGLRLSLNFSFFGLILVYDQLLLPMFHIGSFSYKVSYFLIGIWLLYYCLNSKNVLKSAVARIELKRFSFLIIGIMLCSIAGEFLTAFLFGINSFAETLRSLTIYILMILSFGLGLSAINFSTRNLIWVLYISVILNLLFIFFKSTLPPFLINLYYPSRVLSSWVEFGISDVNEILELARPRGLFENPNGSAFLVNIVALSIYVAIKNKMLEIPHFLVSLGIIIFPMFISVLLASRGEMIVGLILAVLNYKLLFKHISFKTKIIIFSVVLGVIFSMGIYLLKNLDENGSLTSSFDRILSIFEVLNQEKAESSYEARNQGISRPLLMLENAAYRFIYSPFFGSGFTGEHSFPFDHPTQYYHNDWFRLILTSGLIGVFLMFKIIFKYCLPLGLAVVLPFILPGLVNTFLLNIPAVIFYFFMIGFLYRKVKIDHDFKNKIDS